MTSKKVYCCQIFAEASGKPAVFIKMLFPRPAENLSAFVTEQTLLGLELDMMYACEHYRNQSRIYHLEQHNKHLKDDFEAAKYCNIPIEDYPTHQSGDADS